MVIISPQRISLFPFQMAVDDPNHWFFWDDLRSTATISLETSGTKEWTKIIENEWCDFSKKQMESLFFPRQVLGPQKYTYNTKPQEVLGCLGLLLNHGFFRRINFREVQKSLWSKDWIPFSKLELIIPFRVTSCDLSIQFTPSSKRKNLQTSR